FLVARGDERRIADDQIKAAIEFRSIGGSEFLLALGLVNECKLATQSCDRCAGQHVRKIDPPSEVKWPIHFGAFELAQLRIKVRAIESGKLPQFLQTRFVL